MITPPQVRRVAQILYPDLFEIEPVEAIVKALEFMALTAFGPGLDFEAAPKPTSTLVEELRSELSRSHLHINVAARYIGVSYQTIKYWLAGGIPNEESSQRITEFLVHSRKDEFAGIAQKAEGL